MDSPQPPAQATQAPEPERDQQERMHCLNCGTELQGQWCHVCGQPVKSMVRHFASILGDILDTLFEYDNRIWRTLAELYCRPGQITNNFIAGRRMRYVLPFRLFFVLSVLAFLTLQFTAVPQLLLNAGGSVGTGDFARYDTPEEVLEARDTALSELENALAELEADPASRFAAPGIRLAMERVDESAQLRINELSGVPPPANDGPAGSPRVRIGGNEVWYPTESPVEIAWLPQAFNERLNQWLLRAIGNIKRAGEEPARLIDAMLNLLPVVLFVLMPIFAFLLKFFYLLQHRLYMEHLIVALHSHSFLFLAILVSLVLNALATLTAEIALLGTTLRMMFLLSLLWFPLYLLLMQHRVYRQMWPVTLIKFTVLGILYAAMIVIALMVAAVISLINL